MSTWTQRHQNVYRTAELTNSQATFATCTHTYSNILPLLEAFRAPYVIRGVSDWARLIKFAIVQTLHPSDYPHIHPFIRPNRWSVSLSPRQGWSLIPDSYYNLPIAHLQPCAGTIRTANTRCIVRLCLCRGCGIKGWTTWTPWRVCYCYVIL